MISVRSKKGKLSSTLSFPFLWHSLTAFENQVQTQMIIHQISDFKADIYNCARAFRQDAHHMMTLLSTEFNFDITPSISFPREMYRHYNNKGMVQSNWSFYFHGSHCHFENLTTGQVIEVLFTLSPEFGYINPFFFLIYIKTTEKYKWLAEFLNGENIDFAIELLINEGLLTKIEVSKYQNLILAS